MRKYAATHGGLSLIIISSFGEQRPSDMATSFETKAAALHRLYTNICPFTCPKESQTGSNMARMQAAIKVEGEESGYH